MPTLAPGVVVPSSPDGPRPSFTTGGSVATPCSVDSRAARSARPVCQRAWAAASRLETGQTHAPGCVLQAGPRRPGAGPGGRRSRPAAQPAASGCGQARAGTCAAPPPSPPAGGRWTTGRQPCGRALAEALFRAHRRHVTRRRHFEDSPGARWARHVAVRRTILVRSVGAAVLGVWVTERGAARPSTVGGCCPPGWQSLVSGNLAPAWPRSGRGAQHRGKIRGGPIGGQGT